MQEDHIYRQALKELFDAHHDPYPHQRHEIVGQTYGNARVQWHEAHRDGPGLVVNSDGYDVQAWAQYYREPQRYWSPEERLATVREDIDHPRVRWTHHRLPVTDGHIMVSDTQTETPIWMPY